MIKDQALSLKLLLLLGLVASSLVISGAMARDGQEKEKTGSSLPTAASPTALPANRYQPNHMARRAVALYGTTWGVESLSVKSVESGEIIRFSYHVIDADKAKPLNDKKSEPSLIDPQAGVKLVVPSLEKVGQLRQSSTPEAGKSYWMAFSNKGRLVKRGDRVNIVIGLFHADGLVVE
jgi:hypothetical protein